MLMNMTNDNAAVVSRFFCAIDRLIADGVLRGVKTFTSRYGINRWNFQSMKKDHAAGGTFQPSWLSYLVTDFKVSPLWLLTGEGDFWMAGFSAEMVRKLHINCTEKSA